MKFRNFKEWNEVMYRKFGNIEYYFHSSFLVRYVENKKAKIILKKIDCKGGDKVLDAGCGDGFILNRLNKDSVGIDISLGAIKNLKKIYGNKKLVCGNLEVMPISKKVFDKIVCSEVLEHTQYPEKILEEIVRVTVKNGLVVISIPNEKIINKLKNFVKKIGLQKILLKNITKTDYEWHLHVFELDEFKKMISKKLKIKEIISIPFRFLPIRHVIICSIRS